MKLYSITGWKDNFETSETKKLVNLQWWPKPNKHDGLGFRRVVDSRDRVDLYCAWTLIGDIASRAPKHQRGSLIRNNKPLTADDLALMTGFPKSIFLKAFEFFSLPEQAWLTVTEFHEQSPGDTAAKSAASIRVEGAPDGEPEVRADVSEPVPAESAGVPADHPGGREGREGREGKEGREESAPATLPEPQLAHIPTEDEFVAAFMTAGIPDDYLRKQWAWFEGQNEWLDRYGRMKKWQVITRDRWKQDRPMWRNKNGNFRPRSEPNI